MGFLDKFKGATKKSKLAIAPEKVAKIRKGRFRRATPKNHKPVKEPMAPEKRKIVDVLVLIVVGVVGSILTFSFLGILGGVIFAALFLVWILIAIFGGRAGVEKAGVPAKAVGRGIGWFSKKAFRILRIVFVIVLIAGLIWFGYNLFVTGTFTSLWVKGGIEEKAGAAGVVAKTGIAGIIDKILHPEKLVYDYYSWRNPEVVEKKEPEGVIFEKLFGKRDFFEPGEPIEVIGLARVYASEDVSSTTRFSCTMDEGAINGEISISGETGDTVFVSAGKDRLYQVTCKLDGIDLTGEERILTKKVIFKAGYENFVTRGELKMYTLKKEELDSFEQRGIDPFEFYKVRDLMLKGDRMMKSSYTSGPVKLALGLITPQPLTETVFYSLGISVESDKFWGGEVSELKSLRLVMPQDTETFACDLGENLELGKNELEGFEDTRDFWCDFKVTSAEEGLTYSLIKAQVVYDYEFKKSTTVDILEKRMA